MSAAQRSDGLPRAEVPAAFDGAAHSYDRLVGANPGYHGQLRLSAARLRLPGAGAGLRLLDAGCGTGASTAAVLAVAPLAEIVAFDASRQMLAQAEAKGFPTSVRFVHSTVEDLDPAELGGPFDACLAAYLIRNLADPDAGLAKLRGLLKPGARLAIHEYSVADSRLARAVWNAVCWGIVIPAGRLGSGDAALYRHLRSSVNHFDGARSFQQRLVRAGFTEVSVAPMGGWQRGVAHTFLGTAPSAGEPT
ncbi:Methyltransferase type 11 [Kribbella flavida DSM 17836]|uniref:Methyltransferase type 11 n=1 Tax=Kribbella flavida (strain DSM 17836 / JCM 10339 / NBRC 14399) TaxID=479435 RepID=D2PPY8_KRIFD|nr:class I SAM-dependent methyltransferase [Kribbella flavida]ADB32912.1 Methyltransferase type 11 [Kribbella flavida DSM 17836]